MPKSTGKQNFEANSDMFCKILPTISPTIDMSTVNNETIRQTDAEQKKTNWSVGSNSYKSQVGTSCDEAPQFVFQSYLITNSKQQTLTRLNQNWYFVFKLGYRIICGNYSKIYYFEKGDERGKVLLIQSENQIII